jgi:hypothetical protein
MARPLLDVMLFTIVDLPDHPFHPRRLSPLPEQVNKQRLRPLPLYRGLILFWARTLSHSSTPACRTPIPLTPLARARLLAFPYI